MIATNSKGCLKTIRMFYQPPKNLFGMRKERTAGILMGASILSNMVSVKSQRKVLEVPPLFLYLEMEYN